MDPDHVLKLFGALSCTPNKSKSLGACWVATIIIVDMVLLVFLSSGVIHLLHLLMEVIQRALNIQVNSSIKAFLRHMVHMSLVVFFRLQLSAWDQCTICCTAITPGIKWLLCPTRTLGTANRATPVGATTTDTIGFGNGEQGYTQQGFGLQGYNRCGYQS